MFDCRVYWDEKYWRAAHRAVNFKITFNTLEELCNHFDSLGKGDALFVYHVKFPPPKKKLLISKKGGWYIL